ncbi:MAG TPA: acyl carrier protein [Dongiaceae bacterium]|nr:acyl carrier protein [Dongiaceae bacterium]
MKNDRIRTVMADVFGIDAGSISEDASQGTIEQWDSLRHMNLILALEEEFEVRFPEDQIDQLASFKLIALSLDELAADQ